MLLVALEEAVVAITVSVNVFSFSGTFTVDVVSIVLIPIRVNCVALSSVVT